MEERQKTQGNSPSNNAKIETFKLEETDVSKAIPKVNAKGMFIELSGDFTPTIASGTATMLAGGVLKNLLKGVVVKDFKGDLVNSTVGHSRFHSRRMNGKEAPSLYQLNSSSLTSPTVGLLSGNLTTAQPIAIRETIYIPFEAEIAEANYLDTLLYYNGKFENIVKLMVNRLKDILDPGVANSTTFTHNLKFDINFSTTEHSGIAHRWVRWFDEKNISAPTPKIGIELTRLENLAGLMFEVTTTRANGVRQPITFADAEKIIVTVIGKQANGKTETLRSDESLASLAYQDLSKKKMDSLVDGYSYMNFISANALDSAQPNRFTEMWVYFEFPSSLSYTYSFNARVHVDEIDRQ